MGSISKKLSKKEFINYIDIEKNIGLFDIEEANKLLKEEKFLDLEHERKFNKFFG